MIATAPSPSAAAVWAGTVLALLLALPACAADPAAGSTDGSPAALRLQLLAAPCAACHGTEGRSPTGDELPALAGKPAAQLAQRLKEFKRGTRAATVMHQLARGFSDAQLDALAAYFAAREP